MTSTEPKLGDLASELLECIPELLDDQKEMAAVMLLFCGIDILGALDSENGSATRSSFISWANHYMAPQESLGCTGAELYSARCGVVHARSARSALTVRGVAREFIFSSAFGMKSKAPGTVVVHNTSLWDAFRNGTRQFVVDVSADRQRAARVRENLRHVYFSRSK